MTTLKLKANSDAQRRLALLDQFEPSIPAFMSGSDNTAAILIRNHDQMQYTEHWCVASTHWDEAEAADEDDIASFYAGDFDIAERPEPVTLAYEPLFDERYVGEHDDFVAAFNELQFADAA